MRKPLRLSVLAAALAVSALLLMASVASASPFVAPGTYTPTSDSFNSANAPGSSHLAAGTAPMRG